MTGVQTCALPISVVALGVAVDVEHVGGAQGPLELPVGGAGAAGHRADTRTEGHVIRSVQEGGGDGPVDLVEEHDPLVHEADRQVEQVAAGHHRGQDEGLTLRGGREDGAMYPIRQQEKTRQGKKKPKSKESYSCEDDKKDSEEERSTGRQQKTSV